MIPRAQRITRGTGGSPVFSHVFSGRRHGQAVRAAFSLICGLLFSLAALAHQARNSAPTSAPTVANYRDRYSLLSDHNIFTRERGRSTRSQPTSRPATTVTPEQSYVLTGVVLENGERRAYFDDREHQQNIKLGRDESLARGRIVDIDIDAITFEASDGKRSRVEIGNDLTGSIVIVRATDGATTTPSIDPNNPNLTLEERMKLRRMQGK